LSGKVKPGGWFQVWLYAREGNGLILWVLNPVRRLTSRMPLRLLKLLSGIIAVPLVVAAKTVYRLPGLGARLPYGQYMRWFAPGSFAKCHAIIFDQLLAPVAHYMRRDEVLAMAAVAGWSVEAIQHNRGMSWGLTVRRAPLTAKNDPASKSESLPLQQSATK
jgi:hypothetical protein